MTDHAEITQVIEGYIEAGVRGDSESMSKSFHEAATIYSVMEGKSEGGPIQLLFDAIEGNPAPNLKGTIGPIDVNETTATAKVVLNDWSGAEFVDQFTLLKSDGHWQILSKVYHDHT